MIVLEVFFHLSIQVSMSRPKGRSVNFGSIALLTSLAICIAASTKKETDGDLRSWRLIAETGRIEEPIPREREDEGIYKNGF